MPAPRPASNPRVLATRIGGLAQAPVDRAANRKKPCGRCGAGITRDAKATFCAVCRSVDPWFCREAS